MPKVMCWECKIFGPIYSTQRPLRVYGVAILTNQSYSNEELNVKIAQKREGGIWVIVDSAWWRGTPPANYFSITIHPCDSTLPDTHHVYPVYEVYFTQPIDVVDTFAVGTGGYRPSEGLISVEHFKACYTDTLLENILYYYMLDTDTIIREVDENRQPIIFPILVPPDTDSYVCAGVDSVRVQGSGTGWVNVAWAPGSDDQDLFQIAYGVRGEDPDHYASVTNQESPRVIFDNTIDTGVYYSVRVRGRCHHRCAVHDTLMWGPWSDLVHFYVGNHEPGTGIATPEATTAFTLSPNPAHKRVRVELHGISGEGWLTVNNATGQELMRRKVAPREEIVELDVSSLPAGAYFVTVVTPQGSHTEKLVVE